MAQIFGQAVAIHDTAHLAARTTACGQNDPLGGKSGCFGMNSKALRGFSNAGDYLIRSHIYAGALQSVTQDVQYTAGHVAHGIDAAAAFRHGQKTQGGEVLQSGAYIKLLQSKITEAGPTVIVGGGYIIISEIAAAIAGGQQLAAHPALPLQQQDAVAAFRGCQGGHHACRTAADDAYFHGFPSSRRRVR